MGIFNTRRKTGPNGETIVDEADTANAILRKGLLRRLLVLGIVIVVYILARQCIVITYPNEYVAIYQFGQVQRVTQEPGISFKIPLVQSIRSIPKDVRFYDIPISDVITKDKKTMVADSFILWKVSDPLAFIRSLSGNVSSAEKRIENSAYNSMKSVISGMPQSEIISGRDTLAEKIFENMGTTNQQYGIELVGIETKHLDLPDDNKQAVYTRMISERNNIAAAYEAEGEEEARKIRTETDKTVSILLSRANATAATTTAEGEQEYMELLAEAYNDSDKAEFYAYARALEAAKASLAGGDTTLILGSDSPITQVFYNAG